MRREEGEKNGLKRCISQQQSVPLAGGQASELSYPPLAAAMLRDVALVNVQKTPLFTCWRRLLADMSFPPRRLYNSIYSEIKAAGRRNGVAIEEFQPSAPLSAQSLVSTQWRAAVCLTHSSTWLGGLVYPRWHLFTADARPRVARRSQVPVAASTHSLILTHSSRYYTTNNNINMR